MSLKAQLKALQDFVVQCQRTTGAREKLNIVKEHGHLKNILIRIYDVKLTFGVTSNSALLPSEKLPSNVVINKPLPSDVNEFLDVLQGKDVHNKRQTITSIVNAYPEYQELILSIVDKNLKCRIGAKSVMKAFYKDELPSTQSSDVIYKCPLAYDWQDESSQRMLKRQENNWIYSRKLDGIRCITHLFQDKIALFSRSQRPFSRLLSVLEPHLLAIRKELQAPKGDYFLDGELCVIDSLDREDFKAASALVHSHQDPITLLRDDMQLYYYIFDCIAKEEIQSTTNGKEMEIPKFTTRLARIPIINQSKALPLAHFPLTDTSQISQILNERCLMYGHEGLMLRADISGYFPGRTRTLLKAKLWQDAEFIIKQAHTNTMRLFVDGMEQSVVACSALDIELSNGTICSVGSGLTTEDRLQFAKNPPIGQMATIKFQNFDNGNLRFPIFKGLRHHDT